MNTVLDEVAAGNWITRTASVNYLVVAGGGSGGSDTGGGGGAYRIVTGKQSYRHRQRSFRRYST
jgi:hypothetical protein